MEFSKSELSSQLVPQLTPQLQNQMTWNFLVENVVGNYLITDNNDYLVTDSGDNLIPE